MLFALPDNIAVALQAAIELNYDDRIIKPSKEPVRTITAKNI